MFVCEFEFKIWFKNLGNQSFGCYVKKVKADFDFYNNFIEIKQHDWRNKICQPCFLRLLHFIL